jgi:hypothetical protein
MFRLINFGQNGGLFSLIRTFAAIAKNIKTAVALRVCLSSLAALRLPFEKFSLAP